MAADLITRIPQRAARWSAEHPWRAILTWLVLVAAATSLAVLVPTHEAEDADYRIGQSGRADAMAEDAGLTAPDTGSCCSAATLRRCPTPLERWPGG